MKNFYAVSVLIAAVVSSATCDETKNLNRKHSSLVDEACKSNPNLECVREYFSKNGKCEVIAEVSKKRFYSEAILPIYLPVANLTAIVTKTYLDGLDGDFEKFYFDEKTGNLVMSINFKNVMVEAPGLIFAVQQLGMEPKIVVEGAKETYPVVLTAYIPAQKKITAESLKQALFSAYFPNTNSELIIGPKFSESEDPVIAESYKSLAENLSTSVVEIFRTKASFVFLAYLQSRICNFDVSPGIQYKYDTTVLDNIIANNDNCEEATFSEPCSGSDDVMTCVRDYFDREGRCSVVREVEDPVLQRPRYNIYIPSSNFTAIVRNCEMTGLNGTIKKFFINHQTNNLVMTVEFKDIRIDIDEEVPLVIFQRGSTEIRALPYYKDDLYDVILTAVIPLGGGLTRKAMEKAVFSGYFPDFVSHELISPEEENIPQDALLAEIIRSMVAQPVTTAKELYVTDAGSVFRGYFQKYICDFNIPVDPKIYQRYPA